MNLWLAEDAEWSVVSIEDSFWLSADYDTVLIRVPGTLHPLGLGREMHALDCKHDRPENFGDVPFKTTENVRTSNPRGAHADRISDGPGDRGCYRTSIRHRDHLSCVSCYPKARSAKGRLRKGASGYTCITGRR